MAFWQYVVVIGIGGLGIGLVWWAMRRGRSALPAPADPQAIVTELGDLRAAGVLTKAEFEAKKAAILGVAPSGPNAVTSTAPDERD